MTDLMPMMDAFKVLMSNIEKFAEANGAELDYTDEDSYNDSVNRWYTEYVQAKHESSGEEGKYDEYLEVINNIMFEIMGRLEIDENGRALLPQDRTLITDDNFDYGLFGLTDSHTVASQLAVGKLLIIITAEVQTKKGNPFFDFAPAEDQGPAVLKCPDGVVQILADSGFTIEVNPDGMYQFNIKTPFIAYEHQEE